MKFVRKCKPGEELPKTGRKIAIIGAGPAGLAAAGELVCDGHEIHVFDMMPEPGGLLIFGIPDFRIPKKGVIEGIEGLKEIGILFHQNIKVGKDIDLEDIIKGHDAVLIATGTWKSRQLKIPGENLPGVFQALEFIVDFHLHKYGYLKKEPKLQGKNLVIGGGLTAVDACYIARDAGAEEVVLYYRRTRDVAPAGAREFNKLEKEGVEVRELTQPVEFIPSDGGEVEAVKAIKMRLGEKDSSGRPRPIPIEGSEFVRKIDGVLIAAGEIATPPFESGKYGIELTRWNTIKTDKRFRTTRKGVFAAGDVKTGPSLIGPAMASGRKAANEIREYLDTGEWNWEE